MSACEDCGGTGSVRIHSPEDYGVSFECEGCETCGATGVDVPALQADYQGLLRESRRYVAGHAFTQPVGDSVAAALLARIDAALGEGQ